MIVNTKTKLNRFTWRTITKLELSFIFSLFLTKLDQICDAPEVTF